MKCQTNDLEVFYFLITYNLQFKQTSLMYPEKKVITIYKQSMVIIA